LGFKNIDNSKLTIAPFKKISYSCAKELLQQKTFQTQDLFCEFKYCVLVRRLSTKAVGLNSIAVEATTSASSTTAT
jgi:hypothetical protein